MWKQLFTAVLAMGAMVSAQAVQQESVVARRSSAGNEPAAKKLTPEDKKRGLDLLQSAEAQAYGLEGGMRAYSLLQVARAYEHYDKAKALQQLEDALAATRAIDDDSLKTRERLQQQILQAVVPLAPERADELLTQVEPGSRASVLSALLAYYEKNKQFDRALEVIYRIGAEKEIPYSAAARLMEALPAERAGDATQLFTNSLTGFRNNTHSGITVGGGDFGAMVVRYWKRVPRELVLDAVQEILKQADPANSRDSSGPRPSDSISISTAQGVAAFGSYYEYRLFQLLPVLKELDPGEADKLLKKYRDVQTMLSQYPQGTNSLLPQPEGGGDAPGGGGAMFTVGGGPGRVPAGGGGGPSPLEMQRMQKIVAAAEAHPQDSLANAAQLPSPAMRAEAYQGIARASAMKNATASKSALEKLLDMLAQLEPEQQLFALRTAADIYLRMEEPEDARKVVEKSVRVAEKIYKDDSNADDPNKALKAFWPSAEAWRVVLRTAGKISPAWALSLLKEISDPEIKVVAQTALASEWLAVPPGPMTVVTANKSGTRMMTRSEERQ